MRKRLLTVAVALSGGAIIAAGAAQGSSPSSGTLHEPAAGVSVSSAWTGTSPVGVDTGSCDDQTGTGAPSGTSDDYVVTVDDPAGNAASTTQKLTAVVTNKANTFLDLDIIDSTGTTVATSPGTTSTVTATVAGVKPGTYTIQTCTDTPSGASTPYSGIATLTGVSLVPKTSPNILNDQSLGFQPATVVDPTLFGGEPGFKFDPSSDGSRSYVDWPVSSRTNIGVLYRSEDGGLSYQKRYADPNDVTGAGSACIGRQVPICLAGGGGDTNTNIDPVSGRLVYTSQVALANEAAGVSTDHGDTFPAANTDTAVGQTVTGVDRQWPGQFTGTNTVFTGFHVPLAGYYLERNDNGGALGSWHNTVTGTPVDAPAIVGVAQSGSMVIDNTQGIHGIPAEKTAGVQRAIYVGYLTESLVPTACAGTASGFAVGASLDGGKTFTCHAIPGADNARSFTVLALDNQGNLYAAWADSTDQRSYYSVAPASYKGNKTAPGTDWLPKVPINLPSQTVTIFPNIVAGDPGRVAIGYYASNSATATTPDTVKPGTGGWYPYVAESTNALCQLDATPCASPTWHTTRIASKANQDDNICTSGTTCAATMGNRNLLDYFDISLDKQGHLGFDWSDANNTTLEPYVKVTRQTKGPSLYANQPDANIPTRENGAPDAAGDAVYPFYGTTARTSPDVKTLDLLSTTVGLTNAKTIEARVKIAQPTGLGTLPATIDGTTMLQHARYVVRWDTQDPNGHGHAYYLEATVEANSNTLNPGAGEVSVAEGLGYPGGAMSDFGNTYRPISSATDGITAHVADGALVIDAPTSLIGNPTLGTQLVSVGGYSILGMDDTPASAAAAGIPADQFLFTPPVTVDSTPTFDTVLTAAGTQVAATPITSTTGAVTSAAGAAKSGKGAVASGTQKRGAAPAATGKRGTSSLASTGLPRALVPLALLLLLGAFLLRRRTRA